MVLPGLISPAPDDSRLIARLADLMGESFLEEPWTRELLSALDGVADDGRKLQISRAIMRLDFSCGAHGPCCYALDDLTACAGAYLRSDLGASTWDDIESEATARLIAEVLTPEEALRLAAAGERVRDVSDYAWEEAENAGGDYIHFYALGVDARKRHTGAFRRLVTPFFDYADRAGLPCFLETYSDELEALYAHVGFETVAVRKSAATPLVERCMARRAR